MTATRTSDEGSYFDEKGIEYPSEEARERDEPYDCWRNDAVEAIWGYCHSPLDAKQAVEYLCTHYDRDGAAFADIADAIRDARPGAIPF
jgi:hypothetical protein